MTASITPKDINLADPAPFEMGEAHELFRVLRREAPVHFNPGGFAPDDTTTEFKPFWNITKYADVIEISRNPDLWISGKGITQFEPAHPRPEDMAFSTDGKMLITTDPPRHVRLRRLVNKGFTPRAVAAMEGHIREIVSEVLDDISPKGRCDFVTEVAALVPLAVICGMMGVEKKDWNLMFQLTNKVLGFGDPEYQTDVPEAQRGTIEASRATAMAGFMGMLQFWMGVLAERKAQRRDDLVSLLIDADIDGEALTDEEILWFAFLLIVAGNETTRNAMSGGLLVLCQNPEERARLQADMSLIDPAVEEILRWTSPAIHIMRTVTREHTIGGQTVRPGEQVVIWNLSANRDEAVFREPQAFLVRRSPNRHLTFGMGEHFCIGAALARMELRILLTHLLDRVDRVELDGPAERLRSNVVSGFKRLPVVLHPR